MRSTNSEHEDDYLRRLKSIYHDNFEDLYIYAKTITHSDDLAKDVVSDVFYDLIKSESVFDHIRNPRAYLFKSVKNGCIKILSRDPIQFELLQEDQEYQLIEHHDPEELMMSRELEDFINSAVENLSDQCQLVFKMIRVENKHYDEVAEALGISTNTVRNHLVAATKCLRIELNNHFADPKVIKLVTNLAVMSFVTTFLLHFI